MNSDLNSETSLRNWKLNTKISTQDIDSILHKSLDTEQLEAEVTKQLCIRRTRYNSFMYYWLNSNGTASIEYYCKDECFKEALDHFTTHQLEDNHYYLMSSLRLAQDYGLAEEVWNAIKDFTNDYVEKRSSFNNFVNVCSAALGEWDLQLQTKK